ncbi:MAG: cytochrome b/b6 domain-containing protein [Candidatus Binatia bacterium]
MRAALARPLLHTVHLVTFGVLLVTGLLLFVPGLRALLTGGHSQLIRDAHRWGGVAFALLPIVVVLACGPRAIFRAPAERTLRTRWQGLHMAITCLMSGVFAVTGFAIWDQRWPSPAVQDGSRNLHDWLTYAAAALVALHLVEIGLAGLLARIRAAGASEPHLET